MLISEFELSEINFNLQSMDSSSIQLYIKHLKSIFASPPTAEPPAAQGKALHAMTENFKGMKDASTSKASKL